MRISIFFCFCFLFLASFGHSAFGQCPQKIELKKVIKPSSLGKDGKIELHVKAEGAYKGELIVFSSADSKVVKSFSGSSSNEFSFSDLGFELDSYYKIVIIFDEEEKFRCKTKAITNIGLTENQ